MRQTMSRRGRLCVYTRCVFNACDTVVPDEEKVPVSGKMSSDKEDNKKITRKWKEKNL